MIDALPPPWLLAMWAQFATTFRFSLRTIITRPIRAALFGAAGGPIAFLAGERLGAVSLLPPLTQGLLRLSISWAIALVVFSVVVRRLTPERNGPRYCHGFEGEWVACAGWWWLVRIWASGSGDSGATRATRCTRRREGTSNGSAIAKPSDFQANPTNGAV